MKNELDTPAEIAHTGGTKRGPLEVWVILNGYKNDIPGKWLDVMEIDLDAFLASVQDLRRGGHGVWHTEHNQHGYRDDEIEQEQGPAAEQAHADARRDMQAESDAQRP